MNLLLRNMLVEHFRNVANAAYVPPIMCFGQVFYSKVGMRQWMGDLLGPLLGDVSDVFTVCDVKHCQEGCYHEQL